MRNDLSISVEISNSTHYTPNELEIKQLIFDFLNDLSISGNVIVEINFVGTMRMRTLNKKHRHVDKVTDVLSFPIFSNLAEIKRQTSPYIIGSISICPSFCFAKNESMIDMTLHGLIHLIGYDHERTGEWDRWQDIVKEFWLRHQRG
jgi:probable rRNA maturation factor